MRYATVVIRRLLTRLFDDWNRRRPDGSDGTSWTRLLRLEVSILLHTLSQRLLAATTASMRFLTVASPPTGSSASSSRSAADAHGAASPGLTPGERRTVSSTTVRSLAFLRPEPRLPGAHRVTSATSVDVEVAGATPVAPVDRTAETAPPVRAAAPRRAATTPGTISLVAWLRPFMGWLGLSPAATSTSSAAGPSASDASGDRQRSLGWAGQRLVGGAVAVLLLITSVIGVSPVHSPVGATGNVLGAGSGPRIAIGGSTVTAAAISGATGGTSATSNGGSDGSGTDGGFGGLTAGADPTPGVPEYLGFTTTMDSVDDGADQADPLAAGISAQDPSVAAQDVEGFVATPDSGAGAIKVATSTTVKPNTDAANLGAFLADGTILKPIAVDTSIPDARTLLTTYKVRKGDTLTSIAHHFGLSLVTLYWANHLTTNLKSKTDLKVGQSLSIPPVNGVLHIVTDKETLSDIAKRTGVSVNKIVSTNGLKQPTVYVGQWIIVPGAKAKPIPVPKPKPVVKPVVKPVTKPTTTTSRPAAKPTPRPVIRPTYTGGGWVWPAPGGHISQYFHYGHWAVDIADTYGNPVLAAKSGTVIFAGWKNNGGGWQVWISHGNGVYTTYNHMSSLTVGSGQSVAAGHQVGRIGMTGHATGPHLHFEVWIGPIWNGGTRVNPLNYV